MSSPESTSVEIEMDSTTILNLMQGEVELESESESMTDQENLNETQTGEELDESLYIEEESQKDGTENPEEAFAEEDVAAEEVLLYPDLITPLLKLFIFNMMLPTVDTFFDSVLIKKLFEDGYWGSG